MSAIVNSARRAVWNPGSHESGPSGRIDPSHHARNSDAHSRWRGLAPLSLLGSADAYSHWNGLGSLMSAALSCSIANGCARRARCDALHWALTVVAMWVVSVGRTVANCESEDSPTSATSTASGLTDATIANRESGLHPTSATSTAAGLTDVTSAMGLSWRRRPPSCHQPTSSCRPWFRHCSGYW